MPWLALGFMAVGGANKAMGSYSQAKIGKINLNLQADLAKTNEKISELGAQTEIISGQKQKQASQLRTAAMKSTQRAAMAANGIDLSSDTAINILTTTDTLGEIDANTIEANSIKGAWGYRTQGVDYKNKALMDRLAAKSINPGEAATTSLIGSATQVASSYYGMKG